MSLKCSVLAFVAFNSSGSGFLGSVEAGVSSKKSCQHPGPSRGVQWRSLSSIPSTRVSWSIYVEFTSCLVFGGLLLIQLLLLPYMASTEHVRHVRFSNTSPGWTGMPFSMLIESILSSSTRFCAVTTRVSAGVLAAVSGCELQYDRGPGRENAHHLWKCTRSSLAAQVAKGWAFQTWQVLTSHASVR